MSDAKRGVPAVLGSAVAIFWPGAFIFGFPGVMAPYWQESLQVGSGAIGNILFFVLAAVGTFMFIVGRLQERFGTRAMMTIGAIICGLDMVLVAYASSLWMIYLFAFLMGTSSAFIYMPALTTVQRWFPLRRGLVSGIVNFMFGFSAAILCPILAPMLERLGYFAVSVILAVIAIVVGLIAAQFTDLPKQEIPVAGPVPAGSKPTASLPGRSLTVREALVTSSFWFLWFTWALQGAAGIAMVTLSTSFGVSRGFSLEAAVIILTAFNVTNGISRLVTGSVSDTAGRNSTMSFAFLASGFAYMVLPHVNSLWGLAVLAAIIGFAFGALFAVSAPLAMDCFGVAHFGAIFGLVFTAYGFVAGVIGPSVSGYVLDATQGNFHVVFGYLGIFCLISAVFIRFVLPPKVMPADRTSSHRGA